MIDESKRHGWLTKRDAIIGGTKLIKKIMSRGEIKRHAILLGTIPTMRRNINMLQILIGLLSR